MLHLTGSYTAPLRNLHSLIQNHTVLLQVQGVALAGLIQGFMFRKQGLVTLVKEKREKRSGFLCHYKISAVRSCLLTQRVFSFRLMENVAPLSICDSQCLGQHDGPRLKQRNFSNKSRVAAENDPVYALPRLAL